MERVIQVRRERGTGSKFRQLKRTNPFISGLVKFIPEDQMQNRLAILLCNLKPSKMRGINSEAMVMCASTPEKVREIILPCS
jgi:aminoacyl tRNA synthase complex-interacting multifunctional protein 1